MSRGGGTAGVALACALVALAVLAGGPAGTSPSPGVEPVDGGSGAAVVERSGSPPGHAGVRAADGRGAASNGTDEPTETATDRSGGPAFEVSGLDDVVVPVGGPDALRPWNGTVRVTVENAGDRRGSTWVELQLVEASTGTASRPTDREPVTLDPGERRVVSLQPLGVISGGPGNYTIRVSANESSVDGTIAVYFPRYAHFEIDDVASRGFEGGENGTLLVSVENVGRPPDVDPGLRPSQGPAAVSVSVNGIVVSETAVWLGVDESRTVALPVSPSAFAPGRNSVAVRTHAVGNGSVDDEVSFTVTNGTGRTDGADGPGFGPVAALVGALAGLGAWLVRRR